MKGLIFSTCLLMVSAANAKLVPYANRVDAFNGVPVCAGPVAVDGAHVARSVSSSKIVVTGTGDFQDLSLQGKVDALDLKIKGDVLYALTSNTIQEWSLSTKTMISEVPTLDTDIKLRLDETANGMDWHGPDLIISHGGMGYSIYNTVSHKITDHIVVLQNQYPGVQSMLTAVIVVNDQAIFTVSQWTLSEVHPAFYGFLVMDLKTNNEVRRVAGPDVDSTMLVRNGDQLIVGYDMPPLHIFKLQDVLTGKKAPIKKIVMKYSRDGFPVGHAAIADSKLLTCFLVSGAPGHHPATPLIPMAIDLTQLTAK